ncbi:prepilin-type N-terminal cleavage/methylation domain-containing protein [Clostridium collagenovorans DSM 3089]|uniref:Prepilin-type N-terminal cleavage/methylation domain-containing protein n=1 Tax=Clostridium collagenovorans DSM 3089 TaxID=1121306 RepID=A0A1M5TL17_9CLOT|nr:prepilin-type N-terminal cleavage/methylation domain-containing protein [Clostridium collagenovorans]SHH51457.1 prepilin-type N-terminal cleavage/methylation domain-containing protein [Clostridium collagenovorans DSM 3089]
MKKVSRTSKKGFTLVELLVVIGIIGLLAAIILPKFTGYTQKAIQKEATTQARTIYTYLSSHYAEKGSYPSAAASGGSNDGLIAAAGVTAKTDDTLHVTAYNDATGEFTFTLGRGGKTYQVAYDANGKLTETPPAS